MAESFAILMCSHLESTHKNTNNLDFPKFKSKNKCKKNAILYLEITHEIAFRLPKISNPCLLKESVSSNLKLFKSKPLLK